MTRPTTRNWQSTAWMLILACSLGCTPALNWRQVALVDAKVQLLMPCKPDQATRDVVLHAASREVPTALKLQGCEASGMHFTFGEMALPAGMLGGEALAAWRLASLAPLQMLAGEALDEPWQLKGVQNPPQTVRTRVLNDKHQVQWVWFVHAEKIYQAGVYGKPNDKGLSEAAENYFSGIQLP